MKITSSFLAAVEIRNTKKTKAGKTPKELTTLVSRFLNAHFRAPVLLAVERELRLGKHERADEAAGSAIQFLICRLDLEILV